MSGPQIPSWEIELLGVDDDNATSDVQSAVREALTEIRRLRAIEAAARALTVKSFEPGGRHGEYDLKLALRDLLDDAP